MRMMDRRVRTQERVSLSKVPEPLSTAIVSPRQPAGGASQDLRVVTTASHLPGSDLDNYAQTGSSASDPIASAPVPTESTVPSSDDESWEDVMQVEGELVYFEEQATLSTRADWADDRAGSAVDTPCLETTVLQPQDKEKDIDVYAGAVASDAPALDAVADNMDLQPGAPVPTQMSEPGSATNAGHLQASTDPPAPDVRPLREEGAIRDLPHEIMRLAEEFITQ
ncbi:hypothetical protein NEOLEDRAFT_369913 [Neolentinus lepideus HHB14362 ss-1]|uniref:Uncharacterized protein n=1 Tax=Neolentinus lepideus HHB14362 ss-1 TaxID=1314782 RepID=A0A165SHI6_9AGAM|nr:hypothetical protein NEOLEDRAFT_369913 [Neolentinus lepideus HHB14362 ss-1]